MSWHTITLGECFTIKHGFAFKGQHFGTSGEHIILTPGNFHESGGFRSRPGKDRFYTIDPPDGFVLRPGDLVIAMTEQGEGLLGSSALIPNGGKYLHNQRIGLIENLDKRNMTKDFLYRLFNTRQVRGQIRATASGTKVRHTAPNRIYTITVRIPEVPVQRKITDILSSYDDLIENNRRRIAFLEEAAGLLYREWFVHFRFPGHGHVKITDGLPKGWQRLPASEAFEVNPKTPRNDNGAITYVPMSALSETGMVVGRNVFEKKREKSTSVRFQNGDTLFARITPCLENGKTGFVQWLAPGEVACGSTEFIVLRGRHVSNYFVYLTARQPEFRENAIKSMIGSSGRQRVQPSCFSRYEAPIPTGPIADLFEEATEAMFEQISLLDQQNENLTRARDLLLPRLMSGEIAV